MRSLLETVLDKRLNDKPKELVLRKKHNLHTFANEPKTIDLRVYAVIKWWKKERKKLSSIIPNPVWLWLEKKNMSQRHENDKET